MFLLANRIPGGERRKLNKSLGPFYLKCIIRKHPNSLFQGVHYHSNHLESRTRGAVDPIHIFHFKRRQIVGNSGWTNDDSVIRAFFDLFDDFSFVGAHKRWYTTYISYSPEYRMGVRVGETTTEAVRAYMNERASFRKLS